MTGGLAAALFEQDLLLPMHGKCCKFHGCYFVTQADDDLTGRNDLHDCFRAFPAPRKVLRK